MRGTTPAVLRRRRATIVRSRKKGALLLSPQQTLPPALNIRLPHAMPKCRPFDPSRGWGGGGHGGNLTHTALCPDAEPRHHCRPHHARGARGCCECRWRKRGSCVRLLFAPLLPAPPQPPLHKENQLTRASASTASNTYQRGSRNVARRWGGRGRRPRRKKEGCSVGRATLSPRVSQPQNDGALLSSTRWPPTHWPPHLVPVHRSSACIKLSGWFNGGASQRGGE